MMEAPCGVQGHCSRAGVQETQPPEAKKLFSFYAKEIPHFLPFWRLTETTKTVWGKSIKTHIPLKMFSTDLVENQNTQEVKMNAILSGLDR